MSFTECFNLGSLATTQRTNYYQLCEKNPAYAAIKFTLECCIKLEGKLNEIP